MNHKKALLLIIFVLLIDQISKIYVKTHFELQESIKVFDWFQLLFVENDGMAWGAKLSDFIPFISDRTAKLILTLFRIVAVFGIGYWLYNSIDKKRSRILIIAVALIFAGALGNIIDSVFYDVLFSHSYGQVATFLPEGGTNGSIFHGKVVDMLYFPIWRGTFPEWLPFWGGDAFLFFEPVFNVADIAISTGIGTLLIFNKRAFSDKKNEAGSKENVSEDLLP